MLLELPPERGVDLLPLCMASKNDHVDVKRVLLEHDPGSATVAHSHASRGNRHWSAVALLLEQELDLSHEDWLEVQLSCVAGGQTALLAGATYL